MKRQRLYWELEAIASEQLAGELEAWPVLEAEQLGRVLEVLRAELEPGGLLSAEHAANREPQDRPAFRAVRRQALEVLERGAL